MSDKFYQAIFGFLEYDPNIDISQPEYKYRKFFLSKAKFINPAGIKDPEIIHRINLNYRLIFLRDTATSMWIDDSTLAILSDVFLIILRIQ